MIPKQDKDKGTFYIAEYNEDPNGDPLFVRRICPKRGEDLPRLVKYTGYRHKAKCWKTIRGAEKVLNELAAEGHSRTGRLYVTI